MAGFKIYVVNSQSVCMNANVSLFQWEVFSLPELQNFMKILDKEEEEHITQVCQAFNVKQDKLSIEKTTAKNLFNSKTLHVRVGNSFTF